MKNDYTRVGLPCPKCSSSDGFGIEPSGWGHCFVCGCNIPPDKVEENDELSVGESAESNRMVEESNAPKSYRGLPDVTRDFPERGFNRETTGRYRVAVEDGEVYYPLFSTEMVHVGNKVRNRAAKGFRIEGNSRDAGVFGRHAFPAGSAKSITIVEGQDDALAAYQLMGSKWPVVSVHSSSTAVNDIKKDFEYLNSFENIVICFDADEPGQRAARAVSNLPFPVGKLRNLTLRKHKDPNDYLLAKDAEGFTKEWWQAPVHRPDGLIFGPELLEAIEHRQEHFTCLYPFEGLNTMTFGLRLSELVVVTADTGVGKTSVIKHIEHKLLTDPEVIQNGYGVGFLHFEEPVGDTALGLISVHNSVPYHIPTAERKPDDIRRAFNELLDNSRVVMWDHFGSNSIDAVLDKVRGMVALGCRYIIVDHLSIIVSDQSGDERKQLDEITTKLKTLTMELDISVIAIIHTNRQGQIRGTAGVEQLANLVLRLERDKTDANEWRRNVTKITVEKNRFCGYTGPACYLWYNKETGRLHELDDVEAAVFESGGVMGGMNEDIPPF